MTPQEAIKRIEEFGLHHAIGDLPYSARTVEAFEMAVEALSAQPEQKAGKWIRHENEDGEPYGHNCSVCGEWYVMPYGKTKFCPNCGAKMEGQDADGA